MSEDIRRDLVENGLTDPNGNLDMTKFKDGLNSGLVDIEIFK
jgi:hypothetical protein